MHPSAVKSVGRTLAQEPEIAFAAAVSGSYNIHAVAHCRDLDELFEFASERIGSLSGVQSMAVFPLLRQIKPAGTLVSGDRLVEKRPGAPLKSATRSPSARRAASPPNAAHEPLPVYVAGSVPHPVRCRTGTPSCGQLSFQRAKW
ncbi:Lrp/AsnC family transcriptional regulator [Streptomyces lydicus]|uniref:Lrp/AsnC family transcriptional regulator n=1 Tax=Streptomyces lydicus TaxID=47763 RepID=UPI0036EB0863